MTTRNKLSLIAAFALAGICWQYQVNGAAAPVDKATPEPVKTKPADAKVPENERPLVQIALLLDN